MPKWHWLGLNAQLGTFLSGVFTVFVTNMHVVFEEKYTRNNNCSIENKQQEINIMNNFVICWSYKIILCLSIVTILISFFLLYSVYAQIYQGMIAYVIWIIFYEAVNFLLCFLSTSTPIMTPGDVKFLRWFGLISRMFMHGFWMSFVIKFAQKTYKKSQMQSDTTFYSRRLSTIVESKRERPQYPNFPKLGYPSQSRRPSNRGRGRGD
ncbi:transmembrane protein 217-like [Petaurus breviceps papuanus]|uniref:transmembrane protein 217-like n=1 Tax=Petaurus breviceps papuanus TaxID=3040969 RepID=UPI0036DD6DB4